MLKTERLILRRWEDSDAEDLYKLSDAISLEMVESAAACFEKWHGNVRFSAETRENRKVIKRTLRHADVLMACVRVFSEY